MGDDNITGPVKQEANRGINAENNGREAEKIREVTDRLSRDMKFVGIFAVIAGVLQCLTFIGAIFGIPLIIAGIKLRDGAFALISYKENNLDQTSLLSAFQQQQRFFFIGKILIIISIIVFFLYIVAIFFFFNQMVESMEMMRGMNGQMV